MVQGLDDCGRAKVSDEDVLTLAKWAILIEDHYTTTRGVDCPMDIEWAKDGKTGELFIVQARPETVHSQRVVSTIRTYRLKGQGELLVKGLAVGDKIAGARCTLSPTCRTFASSSPTRSSSPTSPTLTGSRS